LKALFRLLGLGQSARESGRMQLAAYAIGTNVFAKLAAFAVLLYSTRVALAHLGTERFGIWVTLSSISTLLSFMDLGISNALVSRVAGLMAAGRNTDAKSQVSRALASLVLLGAMVAAALCIIFWLVPLESWFKGASAAAIDEGRRAAMVFAMLFGLSLPAQAVLKVYAGLQRAWVANVATGLAWCVSGVLVHLAPRLDGTMAYYLLVTFGMQQLAGLLLLQGLRRRRLLSVRTEWGLSMLRGRDEMSRNGRMFFLIQIAVAAVWGSNQLILSSIAGPEVAGEFSVLQRLFMCVQVGLAVLNAPLWAMYADAHAHGEAGFVRRLLVRSMSVSIALALAGVLTLGFAREPLLNYLVQGEMHLTSTAVWLMAGWTVFEASGNAYAMYLNGVGVIRPQVVTGLAYVIASLPAKILAVQWFGLDGLLAAMIASYVLFTVVPLLTFLRRECVAPLRRPA
jgi:O-antigen/teichoic acid export membrane protein